jgi:hypothetical protein
VRIDPRPQETPWTTPLEQDDEHATYDPAQVAGYFAAATRASLVLAHWKRTAIPVVARLSGILWAGGG